MTFLLDTNSCIRYLNGRSESIRQKLYTIQPNEITVCSVVKAELFYGSLKSARPIENLTRQKTFVNRFISFPFDDIATEVYAQIRATLEKKGTPIGPNDLMIASIAVANNLTLITHNTKEFNRVPNLKVEDWEI